MSSNIPALEADIAERRVRLARTLDELTAKATPSAIAKRQVQQAKARFADATTTPEGDLRVERVAAAVAVVAVIVAFKLLRRRRR
ncbi:DUF3618 domain-containing protein [Knoellia aerolata]|uniref:DUF3618 domain-containing protein n=1 Tax=Knoellia aerolata DSM 18566 TaxID=1385519 RepID=A0A0A0JWV9_9MICO|nr:DUF3618 domain-containing protein [Knoellia aerolata]KGN41930.1 hypothetical protein N801_03535 [Knoellia aerolata DSM 18566]